MTPSWRDEASPQAQADLDGLLHATLPFAREMLDDQGEFFPFGAMLGEDDQVQIVAGGPDLGERPASAHVLAVLEQGLRAARSTLRAAAIVSDVRVEGADAVSIELEHRDGAAVEVRLPYRKKRFLRGVDYDEPLTLPGTRRIFV